MVESIQANDWVSLTSRKKMKDSGLSVGQVMMVVSTQPLPAKKSDPYLQRVYVVCMKHTEENGLEIPNSVKDEEGNEIETNGFKAYLIDPRNLTLLDGEDQVKYHELLVAQFDQEISQDETTD